MQMHQEYTVSDKHTTNANDNNTTIQLCNSTGIEFVSSLECNLSTSYEDFQSSFKSCLHGDIGKFLFERFESFNDLQMESSSELENDHGYATCCKIYELPSSSNDVCVDAGKHNFGFISIINNKLSCLTCQYNSNCTHMQYLNQCLDSCDPNIPNTIYEMLRGLSPSQENKRKENSYRGPMCHSKIPIQIAVPPHLQAISSVGLYASTLINIHCDEHGMVPPFSNSKCPKCGSPWSSQDPIANGWTNKTVRVFTMKTLFPCKGLLQIDYEQGWLCPHCRKDPNIVVSFQKQFLETVIIAHNSHNQDSSPPIQGR
ncbi:hypothetical protein AC249_AIPGENE6421 [Exaiptasia diaphana]|nr:hypothetical protein AC249_AIPGENE6421 [Exaiptasia diaphana]